MNRRAGEVALRAGLASVGEVGDGNVPVVSFHLVKIDVDGFKAVNDRFGHTAGDACLRRLAEVARSVLREGDWIARWGGDEFVAGIAAARHDHAAVAVARLAQALDAVAVPLPGESGALTLSASVGSAAAEPGDSPRSLYERADAALYRAKSARPARHQHRFDRRAPPPAMA